MDIEQTTNAAIAAADNKSKEIYATDELSRTKFEMGFFEGTKWLNDYLQNPHGEILTIAYDKPIYDFIVATASRYGEDIYNVMGNWQKIILKEQTNY